jgi:tyrosine-protein kinase Etk/Wzc
MTELNKEPNYETKQEWVSPDTVKEEGETIHFLEPFIVLAKRKALLLLLPLGAGVLTGVVSLLLPKMYTAEAKIMPPQQTQSLSASMLGQLAPLANMAGKDLGLRNSGDLYVAMLRSRTVADDLIQRFDLEKVYKQKRTIDTEKQLENLTEITAGKEGVISVSASDHDPKRAADLANAYIEELQKLTQTLAVTEAGRRRLFFEREVVQASDELARAESALQKTQETTGFFQLDNQSKAIVESAAALQAQVTAKEVQVQSMRSYASAENPDLLRAQQELSALRAGLARMQLGQEGISLADVPMRKMPAAVLQYLRSLRDVKYRESLLELLTKQYEAARIDQGRDAAIIQVLDKAVPPEVRSWPHRSVMVLSMFFVAFLVAIVAAFVLEAAERAKTDPQFLVRLQLLKFYMKGSKKTIRKSV